VTVRWVPPVLSPVSVGALGRGALTAAGVRHAPRQTVIATIADRFDASRVVLTDSGTSALTLALRLTGHSGRPVALPAYSCIDLITAAQGANVTVRLYDLDPRTLGPDLNSLRRALDRGVGAIVVAPLFGYPVDYGAVIAMAHEAGVPLIEDAAQGAGGTYQSRRTGTFGAVSVLSFARGKGTTGGSGGALLFRDVALVSRADEILASLRSGGRGLRDVAALAAQWLFGSPLLYAIPSSIPSLRLGEMVYHPPHEPNTMSDAAATMLESALHADSPEVHARRVRAAELAGLTEASALVNTIHIAPGCEPGYLRFPVMARGAMIPAPRIGALRSYPITLDEHEDH
jgi:hypothetical protein